MDIEQTVRDYIVENFLLGDDSGLDSSQSLLRTGVIDSTGIMELVMFLEETYRIEVADTEMLPENLDSIANVLRFVERKLTGRAAVAQSVPG